MGQDVRDLKIPDFTFGIRRELPHLDPGWQTFPGHYLLYASSGTFTLELAERQWLLPPQRAAWVAANVLIRIRAEKPVVSSSILFAQGSIPTPILDCCVFAVTPLAREMLMHAMRWGMDRNPHDVIAERFFLVVADVCTELASHPEQFWLPRGGSEVLTSAIEYILNHIESALSIEEIAQSVHVSQRTLTRRFVEEANLSCGQFIRRVRMLRAMEYLADPTLPITEVAYRVGFASVSAFVHAFRQFVQETPSEYRRRFLPQ